ncbi:histidine kinase [Prosthecochloris marina]|uniref:Histidine kinase n=1 Tax=Prosthecochloris marina TaxID=2017681 RepID=A0A317T9E2_9CHLB|nr:CBS domain-containing protein [Prosthecochloris marina]PWW83048.1 histidine kinase [Prosthecochloris marina]
MSVIQRHIDDRYPVLQASEKVDNALVQLQEHGLHEAPVLKDGKLVALVSVDDLHEAARAHEGDGNVQRIEDLSFEEPETVHGDQHLLDVFEQVSNNRLFDILPVKGEDGEYEGIVTKSGLLRDIALLFHFSEKGSTLEIEAPALGVKISEVISVIEKNDAMVLSFGVAEPEPGAQTMVMTFRIQCQDIYRLVTNLEKYGYLIRYAKPSTGAGADALREKALEFMRYIDM